MIEMRSVRADTEPKEHECDDVKREFEYCNFSHYFSLCFIQLNFEYFVSGDFHRLKAENELVKLDDQMELVKRNWEEEDRIQKNKCSSGNARNSRFLSGFMQSETGETDNEEMSDDTGHYDRNQNETIFSSLKKERMTNTDEARTSRSDDEIVVDEAQSSRQIVLKKENNIEDLGYTTDDLDSEKNERKYFAKIKEKAFHCIKNKLAPSASFTKLVNVQLNNLKLSKEDYLSVYEHFFAADSSDDDE